MNKIKGEGEMVKPIISSVFACLAAGSLNVNSATYINNAIDQGWYTSSGSSSGGNTSYFIGELNGEIYRNWFAFDLSGINLLAGESIISASLTVVKGSYFGDDHEDWALTSIESNVSDLINGTGTGLTIFDDLADGSAYGAATLTAGAGGNIPVNTNSLINVNLTGANAITDIDFSLNGLFAIGGYLSTIDSTNQEVLFSGTGGPDFFKSVLTIETTIVPVPAAAWLFGSGLIGLIGVARRKARA